MKKGLFTALVAFVFANFVFAGSPPFKVTESGTGPAVILIPGLTCSGDVWDGTVQHLSPHYHCYVLSLPGFGGVPGKAGPFLPRMKSAIEAFIRQKKLVRPVLIGHSLGGFLAYWIASDEPKEIGGVIAVDGVPYLPGLYSPFANAKAEQKVAEQIRSQYNTMSKADLDKATESALEQEITDPAVVKKFLPECDASDQKVTGEAIYEMFVTDLRPKVHLIQCPVLQMMAGNGQTGGMLDQLKAVYQAQIFSIPHHDFLAFPQSRHFIMLDDPAGFYAAVDKFLGGLPAATHS